MAQYLARCRATEESSAKEQTADLASLEDIEHELQYKALREKIEELQRRITELESQTPVPAETAPAVQEQPTTTQTESARSGAIRNFRLAGALIQKELAAERHMREESALYEQVRSLKEQYQNHVSEHTRTAQQQKDLVQENIENKSRIAELERAVEEREIDLQQLKESTQTDQESAERAKQREAEHATAFSALETQMASLK